MPSKPAFLAFSAPFLNYSLTNLMSSRVISLGVYISIPFFFVFSLMAEGANGCIPVPS